jgi:RNA polymerase sigma-70 factor, ECF subfamily
MANPDTGPCVLGVMSVDGEIEGCVRAEYGRLVGVVSLVTGSPQLAEEAVQEAFARAWERVQRGYRFDHLAGWVATVALNQARSGRRRKASERRAVERLAAVPSVESDREIEVGMVVRSAVDGLARRQREAVVLYYLLDIDVATVASLLRVSEGTVKTALARARHKLAVVVTQQEREA